MMTTRNTARGRLMAAGAAIALLSLGVESAPAQTVIKQNYTPEAAADEADALFSRDVVGFSQVRRRNTGPNVQDLQPDQPAAPAVETPAATEDETPTGLDDTVRRNRPGGETGVATDGEGGAARPRASSQPTDDDGTWTRANEQAQIEETNVPAPEPTTRPGGFILSDQSLLTGEPPVDRGLRSPERRRPGDGPFVEEPEPFVDPTAIPLPPPRAAGPDDFLPIPDRWRLVDTLGIIKENPWDPYDQNTLKGDKPIWEGNCFPFLTPLTG
ncbi:MAG: hypothetical protein AAFU55_03260, partial [Pseudomonadota bacterium]